jgi:hypothetical protein
MDTDMRIAMAHMANANAMIVAILVTELDRKGVIDKGHITSELRRACDDAEKAPNANLVPQPRVDLSLVRNTADLIDQGPDQPPPRWTPTIVGGGKS